MDSCRLAKPTSSVSAPDVAVGRAAGCTQGEWGRDRGVGPRSLRQGCRRRGSGCDRVPLSLVIIGRAWSKGPGWQFTRLDVTWLSSQDGSRDKLSGRASTVGV